MFKVNNKVPRRTYFDVTLHVMRASLNVNNIFRGIKGLFVADFDLFSCESDNFELTLLY